MILSNGYLTMTPVEWSQFQELTRAPWQPRSPEEFDAMCTLGAAHHRVENTGGVGWMHALACEEMCFGPNGEMNFPADKRRLAFAEANGTWPTDDELREFEGETFPSTTGLKLVR
jgi:hypothetical protein